MKNGDPESRKMIIFPKKLVLGIFMSTTPAHFGREVL